MKMNKTLVNTDQIFDLVVNCYQTDSDLISKFHVTPGNLSECVDRTVSDFISNGVNVYKVEKGGDLVGYFGQIDNYLNGFFILPKYRANHKKEVWDLISSHFDNDFKTAIFAKNYRASKFLKANGCILEQTVETVDGIGEIFHCEVKKCH